MKSRFIHIGSAFLGMVFGFGYYHYFGCTEGCRITGIPWVSSLYFGVLFLLGSKIIKDLIVKKS
jgi:hypothetical protein